MRLWLMAAAALVVGIVIGFNRGYETGRRAGAMSTTSGGDAIGERSGAATAPQTFTEGAVSSAPETPATVPVPAAEPLHRVEVPVVPATRRMAEPSPQPAPPVAAPRAAPRAAEAAPSLSRSPSRAVAERAPAGPGSLQVVSRPSGAQVVLDGRVVGRTPLVLGDVAPGAHAVRLELPGFQRWATSVAVAPGTQARVAASLEQ